LASKCATSRSAYKLLLSVVSSDFSVELTGHVADLKRDLATWVKAVNALFVAKFEAKAVIIDPTSRV
jgi:hypothetical protein